MKSVRLQSGKMDYPNNWGMYSKRHLGISRIIDQGIGLLIDFPLSVGRVEPVSFISPAKYFPTPFSWDAGFAALGMAGLCPEFTAAGSSFYLTPPDSEIPFIYSGSPLPTQFYSFWSLSAQPIKTYRWAQRLKSVRSWKNKSKCAKCPHDLLGSEL